MRTVKITHTGGVVLPGSTSVNDSETGEMIHGVSRVSIDLAIGNIAKAEVELVGLVVDTEARPAFMLAHPITGQQAEVQQVVWADGTVWDAGIFKMVRR